jgi:hypothetical protein
MASKDHKESKESMRFLDRLTDFLGTSEEQTKDEVKADLRDQGVDIDKMLIRGKEMIRQTIAAKKLQWLHDATRIREEMRKQIEVDDQERVNIQTIKEKIKEWLGVGEQQEQALLFFRNFEQLNDDDLREIYKEYMQLLNLKKGKNRT